MILSASRRTDIPAFYSDWFFNRLKAGYLQVVNPYNKNQIRTIELSPDKVECIVFWTKDPADFISRLNLLQEYNYYFLFTVNSYPDQIEQNLRSSQQIIRTFRQLSALLSPERVIWRYDPIFFCQGIDEEFQLRNFDYLTGKLADYTEKCIISFIDYYQKTSRKMSRFLPEEISDCQKINFLKKLEKIASRSGIKIEICSEAADYAEIGIEKASCIDLNLINQLTGKKLKLPKDPNQRKSCNCVVSVDIGTYNTCKHNCLYCYASNNCKVINTVRQNPDSPFIGNI
ncbi:MAG: hypothetical protein APR54_12735 [Candidatus Cloacimonas sp. SDB]|nr:MAG: hypothetical protein APR54_12735 [Candidatus Cloacimonas sp. SDB]